MYFSEVLNDDCGMRLSLINIRALSRTNLVPIEKYFLDLHIQLQCIQCQRDHYLKMNDVYEKLIFYILNDFCNLNKFPFIGWFGCSSLLFWLATNRHHLLHNCLCAVICTTKGWTNAMIYTICTFVINVAMCVNAIPTIIKLAKNQNEKQKISLFKNCSLATII